jgi:hypothetical protein
MKVNMTREEAALFLKDMTDEAYRMGFRAAIKVLKNSWHHEVPCDDEEMDELMQQMEDELPKENAA